jgi:arylsulfatase A-like enzyme
MAPQSSPKPNILLITTDTSRCDTLACMGYDFAISPNIDRLAREGTMFLNAHTSSPVCCPARCSLLTGLHTPSHGVIENGVGQRRNVTTLPDLLAQAGYRNFMIGKTHFGAIPETFERVIGADDYRQWLQTQPGADEPPLNRPAALHGDSYFVDRTIQAIGEAAGGDKPFFAFCSLNSPHPPARPPREFADALDLEDLPELNYIEGEEQGQPLQTKLLLDIKPENTLLPEEDKSDPDYWREAVGRIYEQDYDHVINEHRRRYYSYAAFTDSLVGRLTSFLDESGLSENTLVLFTSDHGQQNFDHGFNDKHNYYDESWRIPFILRMPGTIPAGAARQFAIWNDIPTTLLAAAGVESPTMQGYDLFTPLAGDQPSPRRCAVATLYKSCAVATQRWKLEYFFEEAGCRLFDRLNDPKERNDLYDSPEHRTLRDDLVRALLTWRADLVDLETLQAGTMSGQDIVPKPGRNRNVAPRAAEHVQHMRGADAEDRLAEAVSRAEARFETSDR